MTRPREAQLPLLLTISEGLCRGTDEMLKVSPKGDAIHPPSCGLAIRDAVEEIKWLRAKVERLHDDARRDRWLRDQPDLYLVTDGTKWCDLDGSDFRVSHQLSIGDSRMGVYETLDETVDHAMTLEAKP